MKYEALFIQYRLNRPPIRAVTGNIENECQIDTSGGHMEEPQAPEEIAQSPTQKQHMPGGSQRKEPKNIVKYNMEGQYANQTDRHCTI